MPLSSDGAVMKPAARRCGKVYAVAGRSSEWRGCGRVGSTTCCTKNTGLGNKLPVLTHRYTVLMKKVAFVAVLLGVVLGLVLAAIIFCAFVYLFNQHSPWRIE